MPYGFVSKIMRKAFSPLIDYAGHISLWGNELNQIKSHFKQLFT